MKYKAALFDMNGVMVNDEPLHESSFARVLRHRGFEFCHDEYIKDFSGKTDEAGFRSFFESRCGHVPSLDDVLREKAEAYQELAQNGLQPYAGVIDYIMGLYQNCVRLALVTSSLRVEAETVLRVFRIVKLFQVVITADEITRSKPDPQGYLMAMEALGLPAEDVFIVEDAPSGVRAANSAKIACLAVTNTHSAHELA